MNRDKLEKRLKLYREIAADHPPGESRRGVERACEAIETHIKHAPQPTNRAEATRPETKPKGPGSGKRKT